MTQEQKRQVTREVGDYAHRELAVAKLQKSGVVLPATPFVPAEWRDKDGMFLMPEDITVLESKELGCLMSLLNGLLLWYGAVLASARIDRLAGERVKNFIESKKRMEIFDEGDLEKRYKAREDKEAYVNVDSQVIQAQDWFDKQQALVIMAEQLYFDYDRSFKLVSREISRRGGEFGNEQREHKVG